MLIEQPYFMTNRDWWTRDEENDVIILTNQAPIKDDPRIIKSYRDYLKKHNFGKNCRGGYEFDFDIDDDKEFEKYISKMLKML